MTKKKKRLELTGEIGYNTVIEEKGNFIGGKIDEKNTGWFSGSVVGNIAGRLCGQRSKP